MTECDHTIGIDDGYLFYESLPHRCADVWFKFCPHCGTELPDPSSRPEPLPRPVLEGPPTLCGSIVNESLAILRNNLVFSGMLAKPLDQPTESTIGLSIRKPRRYSEEPPAPTESPN